MIDWKVGDRVIWVDWNEFTGEEGTVLRVDNLKVRVKFNDLDRAEDYYLNEKCLVRWPK